MHMQVQASISCCSPLHRQSKNIALAVARASRFRAAKSCHPGSVLRRLLVVEKQ